MAQISAGMRKFCLGAYLFHFQSSLVTRYLVVMEKNSPDTFIIV